MPGFYITNCRPVNPQNMEQQRCIQDNIQSDGFCIYRNTLNRYLDDKAFYQDERYVVIFESVLMNKTELLKKYETQDVTKLLMKMLEQHGDTFFSEFRGMFSGAVYLKKEKRWIVFCDQIGNKAVFYYFFEGKLIIGSQLNYITDTMKYNSIEKIPDENGMNQFLNFGCFMDDSSWLERVKRILPGDYITVDASGAEVHTYYRYPEEETPMTEAEAIERLDHAFCNAVMRGIEKDREYGYTSIVDISGGADSRMIAYTARRLGMTDGILAHYSQSGSNEMKVAQQIARELQYPCYLNMLDDAEFMKDAEENIRLNNGTGYYFGITGGKRVLKALSGNTIGLEFTGLLGDISEGAMLGEHGMLPPDLSLGRFRLTDSIPVEKLSVKTLNRFKTNNMFWLYTRGMLCGMSTFFTRQNYVEPYTPYGDVEFFETVLTVPYRLRTEGKVQLKWMRDKYPTAIKLMYASSGLPLALDLKPCGPLFSRVYVKLMSIKSNITGHSTANMNPVAQWEREKEWLVSWKKEYFEETMREIQNSWDERQYYTKLLAALFEKNWMAQYLAITVASCIKEYILD